jgi:uncharacterized protein YjbI with pentapeptide repeats
MANEEHLKILRQGVEVWNQWRKDNPEIMPNLSGISFEWSKFKGAKFNYANFSETDFSNADLSGKDLRGINLSGANLSGANLNRTNLNGVNLCKASLSGASIIFANLVEADLCEANITGADLRGADISGADLSSVVLVNANLFSSDLNGVKLISSNLEGANLIRASLMRANLLGANLSGAELVRTDLSEATLNGATLKGTTLFNANLNFADLSGADLSGANLSGTDFTGANLSRTNLTATSMKATRLLDANLDGANLTGACLWETQRADWSIKGIICESVYWDIEPNEKIEYAAGEFERLFADQTKIKLHYKDGISPLEIATLPALIHHLEEMQGYSLRFVSITEGAGGAVVELAIEDTEEKSSEEIAAIKQAMEAEAERNIQILRDILESKEGKIKKLKGKVEGLKETISDIWRDHKGETIMGDKYEISGQVGAVGKNARADHNTFNQLWNQSKDSIDLAKLAEELAQLRTALKQEAVEVEHDVAVGEVGQALIEAKAGNGSKVMGHLKAAGKWAFDTATKIGTSVAADVIKKSMGL